MKDYHMKDYHINDINSDIEELANEPDPLPVGRRDFMKILGGGIFVLFNAGKIADAQNRRRGYPADFNAYVRIGEDGRVTCLTGKIEMGQGIVTSLAQMLAEELDVPFDSVDMIMGDTAQCPWDMGTWGSMTTPYFGPPLRKAAATARATLVQLAAKHFETSPGNLGTKDGTVFMKNNPAKKISYAQLTKGKKIQKMLDSTPPLKEHSKHFTSGKPARRKDAPGKVTGKARYAADVRLPGMLYAKLVRPPVHGAKLKSVDVSAANKVEGVRIVQGEGLVAALHKYPDEAERARDLIKAQFDMPTAPKTSVTNKTLFKHLQDTTSGEKVTSRAGNLETGKGMASKTVTSQYFNHYVSHAPLEPHAAAVNIEGTKATVWASTQAPFRAQAEVARALGFKSQDVRVITPPVGGGFGGKSWNMQVVEAAKVAKLAGKPVQVAWNRPEEFFYDAHRPAAVVNITSGINDKGEITFWDKYIYFAGSRGSEPVYHIPHLQVKSRGGWNRGSGDLPHAFNVGAWRGPGTNTNIFALESQIDIMAQKAGMDPLSFRLKNLRHERQRKVLKTAADMFGHAFSKGPSGKGYGIACSNYHGGYVATMAEVKVDRKTGKVKVERIVAVQDIGEIINPEGAVMQVEGGITMGLGYTLTEELQVNDGDIKTKNFGTYQLPRFSWSPKFEVKLIDNPTIPPAGNGELAITATGALIANAIHDAAGARLYELPMTPERIRKALAS
ncbi:MAG: molybdopterin-dependent oxidoreductase [bacterium]|nr:molybdopterin-dependent oxidoreductase [bacterium]